MNDYTIGVVGLGNMGLPIAENLATGGFPVTAYDIDPTRRSPNVALDYCGNLSEMVAKTARLLFSLPDYAAVLGVTEELSRIPGDRHLEIIDTSTIGPKGCERIAQFLAGTNITYMDSPVSGGVRGAKAGTLAVMCAGPAEFYEASLPHFEAFTANQFYIGERCGQAQVMKILNNFLSATALSASTEAILYGISQGLEIRRMCDVINVSTGINSATRDKFPQQVATGLFNAGFSNTLMLKDIELYLDGCTNAEAPHRLGEFVVQQWREFGADDPGADATKMFTFKKTN